MFHVKHETLPPVDVSRETAGRLDTYADLIRRWSATLNLVAAADLPRLDRRHIADSLQLLPLLPDHGPLIDLGSGAGFPGLVLAIASGRPVHLVEADRRKAIFLREAARTCGADIIVHAARIEHATLPPAALVTARALAPLSQLLTWAAPLLAPGGAAVFPKGRRAESELTEAARDWQMNPRRWRSRTDPDAVILHITEIAHHDGSKR